MLTEIGSTIKITDPSSKIMDWCKSNLVLVNPDYQKKVRMHLWVGDTPKQLFLYSMNGNDLILPFGCLRSILPLLEGDWKKLYRKPVKVDFGGKVPLYEYQEEAVAAMLINHYGILQSPAGSGKTQMGIALAAALGVKTLWLTHTKDLLTQSKARAAQYINPDLLGTITEGKVDIGQSMTFATIQTMCKPIRLIELFAGVGSQAMALRDLEADFEHYRVVEFDKYPIASYNAIHGTNFPTMDITKIHGSDLGIVDTHKFVYMMTYSFPCQDLSVAGKGGGMTKGSGTRSGLLWEVERLLNETDNLPQVLVMENVPQVHSKKNMPDFQNWLNYLESKGYTTYWQDLNAMNYGVPQSRNRCIAVSILGEYDFDFPTPEPLTTVMADFLEEQVENKYYLTSDKAKDLIDRLVEEGTILPLIVDRGGGTEAITVKNCGSSDENRTPDAKRSNVATTLLARDYKGFSNYGSNAAIECQRVGVYRERDGETPE